jgi:hypothetical protein
MSPASEGIVMLALAVLLFDLGPHPQHAMQVVVITALGGAMGVQPRRHA